MHVWSSMNFYRPEAYLMKATTRLLMACKEAQRRLNRGQTMAEYGLILAAIAVVVFVVYQQTGNDINNMVTWQTIDTWLLGAS